MNRRDYLDEVIRLYLASSHTPSRARPRDWAIAATFYRQGIPLSTIAHAIRLATLRRHLRPEDPEPLEPIHSLAYFRRVLRQLSADDCEPGYIQYIHHAYQRDIPQPSKDATTNKNATKKPNHRLF